MNPRRVLFVSADIGEGHNASADALAAEAKRLWPECETKRVDALRTMGRPVPGIFKSVYGFELRHAPWIYQGFYDALWTHPLFAGFEKRVTGSWCARRLARVIDRFEPDFIVSTYPIGSAALDWLRRERDLPLATATFISDFAAHPFWVFPNVDVHYVMHGITEPDVRAVGVEGPVRVAAPPVRPEFFPRPPGPARRKHGLRSDAFIPLVTGGAWGVGTLEDAILTLTQASEEIQVVAVCGHNEALLSQLTELGLPRDRLVPLGFVDTMPDLMSAADVIVTNAGGVTSLEAFASGRPLLLFDPIAGHGKANADLMEQAGLAIVCPTMTDLTTTARELIAEPGRLARMRADEASHLADRSLGDDLKYMAVQRPRPAPADNRPVVRTISRVARLAAVAAALALVFVNASAFAGTRFAPAARGAAKAQHVVAVAVAGSFRPEIIAAIERQAKIEQIPLSFFVQGRDAQAYPKVVAQLAKDGFEIESGTWSVWKDQAFRPGAVRHEFDNGVKAVALASGRRPTYVAEPGGRFGLFAIEATGDLNVRRVVFGQRYVVSRRPGTIPELRSGTILELQIRPEATPATAAAAVHAIATELREDSLRALTVAAIDALPASKGTAR